MAQEPSRWEPPARSLSPGPWPLRLILLAVAAGTAWFLHFVLNRPPVIHPIPGGGSSIVLSAGMPQAKVEEALGRDLTLQPTPLRGHKQAVFRASGGEDYFLLFKDGALAGVSRRPYQRRGRNFNRRR